MADELQLSPSASALISSMRDMGYSFETAIADLIDNSISADATSIQIIYDPTLSSPALVISDNGHGMSRDELISAMRHGSMNPKIRRNLQDLGRFGLGLKTASFSQCRKMTIASFQNGNIESAVWDLDLVDEKDDWVISILNKDETSLLPFIELLRENGTLVIWQNLDRFFEGEKNHKRDEITSEKLNILDRHLSLVFHRFLSGELSKRKKISITINGHKVEPFDPFCRKNPATQLLPKEIVVIDDEEILIQPYILPHHSKLTEKEYQFYQDRSDFLSNQGAYVYRGGRLMAWGNWFRLISKGEATKLARVQIDFPNSLDELWTIDIKKSRATPPPMVKERLRQIIQKVSTRSTTVHSRRGEKLFEETKSPLWERYIDEGKIIYSINNNHPVILSIYKSLNLEDKRNLHLLIDSISSSLPVDMIYSDSASNPKSMNQFNSSNEDVVEKLHILKSILFSDGLTNIDVFKEVLQSTKQFSQHADAVDEFILKELK